MYIPEATINKAPKKVCKLGIEKKKKYPNKKQIEKVFDLLLDSPSYKTAKIAVIDEVFLIK